MLNRALQLATSDQHTVPVFLRRVPRASLYFTTTCVLPLNVLIHMQRAAFAQVGQSPPPEYTAHCRRLQRACRMPAWSKAINQEQRHRALDGDTTVDQEMGLAGTQGADQQVVTAIPVVPDVSLPALSGLPHLPDFQQRCMMGLSDALQPTDAAAAGEAAAGEAEDRLISDPTGVCLSWVPVCVPTCAHMCLPRLYVCNDSKLECWGNLSPIEARGCGCPDVRCYAS